MKRAPRSRLPARSAPSRRLGVGLLCLLALASLGCPEDPDYSPEMLGNRDTNVYMNVRAPETVVMVAGDRVVVEVDTTTNNHQGRELPTRAHYTIALAPRYATHGGAPEIAEYAFDHSAATPERPRLATLSIETREDAPPGVYAHEIDNSAVLPGGFSANPPAVMNVVILPTDGEVQTAGVSRIAAGLEHTLALLEDGTVWAWGSNDRGQLGDGTLIDRSAPVQVTGFDGPVRGIAAGRGHSVALSESRRVYTWGAHDGGQLGKAWSWENDTPCPGGRVGSDERDETFSTPRFLITGLTANGCDYRAPILDSVVEIAAGDDHTIARRADGSIVSFGSDDHGQLGVEFEPVAVEFVQTVRGLFGTPVALAAGGDFSLALHANGIVEGWGDNSSRQLGMNDAVDIARAIDVPFTGDLQIVAAGERFVLARRRGEPGYVAWGSNTFGQLGDGTTESHGAPRQLATYLPITQLAAGNRHALATLPSGVVYTWGDNGSDQMAGATSAYRQLTPIVVPRLTGMSVIAAGGFHSLARHNQCRNLWSWGRNASGQLGQADLSLSQATPLPVYGLGEGDLGDDCEVALRVWQDSPGVVSTADADFGDEGCDGAYCGAGFAVGSVVTLTATPDDGWEFVGWKGDCGGASPTTVVTLDHSANCIARYQPIEGFDAVPTASFRVTTSAPEVGQPVAFDASDSSDDQGIDLYEWDFEDDGSFDAVGRETSHVFPAEGSYRVRLRVTDASGQGDEATRIVEVGPASGGGGDVTLTVRFLGGGSGRVISNPGGIDCTSTCSATFPAGTALSLNPVSLGSSVFSHWGLDPAPGGSDCDADFGGEGCGLELETDRSVRVYFE